ncbi:MAG: type I-E CRISPR-associated protein Cas5/CasD [Chloroflexi bacterium]|nr:type I-E CRISPR-associated protein Cas5/CasD [Chloroflexota bacterium]
MLTLLMRISAPMQSWGTQSHFSHRDTGREPSKSGMIGLLCAALGRPRDETIDDLRALKMGVRIDRPGDIRRDYHTAGIDGYYKVSGSIERRNAIVSERYYLSDAIFLVGLEGEAALLERLQAALQRPRWFLFFGRKAFIPAERVWLPDGLRDDDLETALRAYRYLGRAAQTDERLQMLIEDDKNGSIVRNDQLISFKPRRFIPRRLRRDWLDNPAYQEEA